MYLNLSIRKYKSAFFNKKGGGFQVKQIIYQPKKTILGLLSRFNA